MSDPMPESPETPEPLRSLLWLWHHTRVHREALTRPPVLLAFAIFAAVGYWLGASHGSTEASIKDQRLAFANDQLAAYKDRLQGATPDQAAQQMTLLQKRVSESEGKLRQLFPENLRQLQPKEKELLLARKEVFAHLSHPLMVFADPIGDSAAYARSFVELFEEQKMETIPISLYPCNTFGNGILVGIKNLSEPSDAAKVFVAALRHAGLAVSTYKWTAASNNDTLDFNLFICPAQKT
jgi:hypothetical protein